MKKNARRQIILCENSKSEYPWSLQECYDSGETIGEELVLCDTSIFFTASKLEYNQEIKINFDGKGNVSESITGILQTNYTWSFFGADKQIEYFKLRIHKITEKSEYKEVCFIIGHSVEPPESDYLYIHINLLEKSFNNLLKLIQKKCLDVPQIILNNPNGFYSQDPFICSKQVKILNKDSLQLIKNSNCSIIPSVLGNVEEFILNFKTKLRIDSVADSTPAALQDEIKVEPSVAILRDGVCKNVALLKNIFTAICVIVLLLFFMLIR